MKLLNTLLSARCQIYIWLNLFPKINNAHKKIIKLGFNIKNREFIDSNLFKKKLNINYGSARPDMDSIFHEDCVIKKTNSITILTKAKKTIGYQWDGKLITKNVQSGLAYTDNIFYPKGLYFATILIDNNMLGAWPAWWFLHDTKIKYEEIDMFERFISPYPKRKDVTISVWTGKSSKMEDRKMYNNSCSLPNKRPYINCMIYFTDKKRMKVYINGLLVFIGRKYFPTEKLSMRINSGLQKNMYKYHSVINSIQTNNHTFIVKNLFHYIK
jgi:hypothetical protein